MSGSYDLNALFAPKVVAIIGASATPGKIGNTVIQNLIDAGYEGKIIPVNPKSTEILGRPVVKDVAGLPHGLDLAVLTVPKQFVLGSMEELVKIGVKSAIIITAGFKEVGGEGAELEKKIQALCIKNNIALVGPNCLGLINMSDKVNVTFAPGQPLPGRISCFSQSGALFTSILDWALGEKVGFSKFISLGNEAVLNESHILEYLGNDPDTSVVMGYMENIIDGQKFIEKVKEVTRKKPVVVVKSGVSSAGAKAAASHTGSIAGADNAYSTAFKQTGVIRAQSMSEFFNLAQAFSKASLPQGPNLAIITNAGGPGIMATDACEKTSLKMVQPASATIESLKKVLPSYASFRNPLDIGGDATATAYKAALEEIVADDSFNAVLVILTPTSTAFEHIEAITQGLIDTIKKTDKPVFPCFMGKERISIAEKMFQNADVPFFTFPEPAIESIETMYKYAQWKEREEMTYVVPERDKAKAAAVVEEAVKTGAAEIVEYQAQQILKAYNMPALASDLATTADEAAAAAEKIGFPVVLKIASVQISHKSDVGGVKVGLKNAGEVRAAFTEVTERAAKMRPDAHITGCLIQQMAPKGTKEIIIGFKRDAQFGPLLMFGLGGIYVEILKDIAFRLVPLSKEDAHNVIREIKTYKLLSGARGEKGVNFESLEDVLLKVSQLAADFPQLTEADFNPVLVNSERAYVADVRLALK
ncbi:acetate--CoA ligase family protein [Limibacterium fermenti]|uniref:acetate--CoA ligase family protein n=1 Tax=Limibacterium fermenti TaxID=3229863 RepID=UPI003A68023C